MSGERPYGFYSNSDKGIDRIPRGKDVGVDFRETQEGQEFDGHVDRVISVLREHALLPMEGSEFDSPELDEEDIKTLIHNQGISGEPHPRAAIVRAVDLLACQVWARELDVKGSQEGHASDEDEETLGAVIEEVLSDASQHDVDVDLHGWVEAAEELLGRFESFETTSPGTPEREEQIEALRRRSIEFDRAAMGAKMRDEAIKEKVTTSLEGVYGHPDEVRQLVQFCFNVARASCQGGDLQKVLTERNNESAQSLAAEIGVSMGQVNIIITYFKHRL